MWGSLASPCIPSTRTDYDVAWYACWWLTPVDFDRFVEVGLAARAAMAAQCEAAALAFLTLKAATRPVASPNVVVVVVAATPGHTGGAGVRFMSEQNHGGECRQRM